jgi:hypothetical protein
MTFENKKLNFQVISLHPFAALKPINYLNHYAGRPSHESVVRLETLPRSRL